MKNGEKKLKIVDTDLVRDTEGGEMPDPKRKPKEKASEAADIFEQNKSNRTNETRQDREKEAS